LPSTRDELAEVEPVVTVAMAARHDGRRLQQYPGPLRDRLVALRRERVPLAVLEDVVEGVQRGHGYPDMPEASAMASPFLYALASDENRALYAHAALKYSERAGTRDTSAKLAEGLAKYAPPAPPKRANPHADKEAFAKARADASSALEREDWAAVEEASERMRRYGEVES